MSDDSSLWPLGVTIYLLGTIGESLGANLQRRSLKDEQNKARQNPTYVVRKKRQQARWRIGFMLFVGAGIGMSTALFFASITLLAPMQLFLFFNNAIFANFINKEPFAWIGLDGLSMVLVMTGVTLALISAPKTNHDYNDEQMLHLMKQAGFISFCIFAGLLICTLWISKKQILRSCDQDPSRLKRRWLRTYLNTSFGALAGAFGGVNVTLTKTTFSLIIGEFKRQGVVGVLSSPVLWVVAIVLVSTYVLQILVTVDGLEIASAIIVISAHSVTEEVVATLGGILYFQDYKHFSKRQWIMFIIGNVVAIVSVIALSHLRLRVIEAEEAFTDSDSSDIEASVADETFEVCPDTSRRSNISLGSNKPKNVEENFTTESQHIKDKKKDQDNKNIKVTKSFDSEGDADEKEQIEIVKRSSFKFKADKP